MDMKRIAFTILIAGALYILMQYLFPKPGAGAAGGAGGALKTPYGIYMDVPAAATASEPGAVPDIITLGSSTDDRHLLAVTINTQSAGIDTVELNIHQYAETTKRDKPLTLFSATGRPLPFSTQAIRVRKDGVDFRMPSILATQYNWKVVSKTDTQLKLMMTVTIDNAPALEVTKTFTIDPASYEVKISHSIKNLSGKPLQVAIDQFGPSELPRDDPQTDDRFFHAVGLNSATGELDTARLNVTQLELSKYDQLKDTPGTKSIGTMGDKSASPILWVASSNRFFVTIARPLPSPAPAAPTPPVTLKNGRSITVPGHMALANLDLMKWAVKPSDALGIVRFTGTMLDLAPDVTLDEPMTVYMGPKTRDGLRGNGNAAVGSEEYEHDAYAYLTVIQLKQGGCYSYCTFEEISWFILRVLDFFKRTVAFGNYGVAIIILVIMVRACLHPLTRSSQVNMAKMSKAMKEVAPQLEAVKRKYPGDTPANKRKQQEETMRVYRENNVNPAAGVLGCLPMLIQMPIWAALWSGLRTDIDLRHAAFIPGWISDLSHPDMILPRTIPVIGSPLFTLPLLGDIYGLNLLPLLLAVVFFIQMKVTTASQPAASDPQQAQMQKMSQYMVFLFPLFLYSAPSGLNLYIFASTIGGLFDTWLVRKSLKKRGILPASAPALPTHEAKPE